MYIDRIAVQWKLHDIRGPKENIERTYIKFGDLRLRDHELKSQQPSIIVLATNIVRNQNIELHLTIIPP